MTDPFDRLRQPVEPLPPPAGTFDLLLARAHRRRTARTTLLAALVAVVLSVGGGLTLTAGRQDSSGRLVTPAGPGHPPSPSASPTPSKRPPATAATPTPPGGLPIPRVAPGGPVPPGFLPYSVTSVGGGVTYLLGDAPCRTAPCTSVVRSTDGGRSWIGVPAPKAALPRWQAGRVSPGSTVRDLRFASLRDGWAFGGALYATHDGARTWRPVDVGGSVLDLATDGSTTYAVVAACDRQGFNCSGARLRSTKADRDDWRDVSGVGGGVYDDGQLSLGGGVGVVTLSAPLTGPGREDRLFVRSGVLWKPVGPPCANRLSAVAASASAPRLFAFCGDGAAGSVYLTTYLSDDNGSSWRRQAGTALQLPSGPLVTFTAPTADVVLAASTTPDRGGRLARSADGGRTWNDAAVPALPYGWRYVGARTASSVVALPGKPDGSVWNSSDGGLRWAAYRFR